MLFRGLERITGHPEGIIPWQPTPSVAAKGRGIFANIADSASECDFIVPARVQRGSVHIAVSTGGESPRLSAELRRKLEDVL
jgi:siroheme synthase-like protein